MLRNGIRCGQNDDRRPKVESPQTLCCAQGPVSEPRGSQEPDIAERRYERYRIPAADRECRSMPWSQGFMNVSGHFSSQPVRPLAAHVDG